MKISMPKTKNTGEMPVTSGRKRITAYKGDKSETLILSRHNKDQPLDDADSINALYAQKHGYRYQASNRRFTDEKKFHVTFERVAHTLEAIRRQDVKVAMWLDPGAVVWFQSVPLDPIVKRMIKEKKDIAFCIRPPRNSVDGQHVNLKAAYAKHLISASVFIVRDTEWSRQFLSQWIDQCHDSRAGENSSNRLREMVLNKEFPAMERDNIIVFPETAFNSKDEAADCHTFVRNYSWMERSELLEQMATLRKAIEDRPNRPVTLSPAHVALNEYMGRQQWGNTGDSKVLVLLTYDDTIKLFSQFAEYLARITCARTGWDFVRVFAPPTDAFYHAVSIAQVCYHKYIAVLTPGATFKETKPFISLPSHVDAASAKGISVYRVEKLREAVELAPVEDGESYLPPMNHTTHSTGLRREIKSFMEGKSSTDVPERAVEVPPDHYETLANTLEDRDKEALVWMSVAVVALLIAIISGLVLRYGPNIRTKADRGDPNFDPKKRYKW
nr:hypothetical protein [Sicyoidochytrium minutum DNA virus]